MYWARKNAGRRKEAAQTHREERCTGRGKRRKKKIEEVKADRGRDQRKRRK
jgi:hypothetical protein